jgi:hypothetical protein
MPPSLGAVDVDKTSNVSAHKTNASLSLMPEHLIRALFA